MSQKLFDIVVLGATGFTGHLVAEYLAQRLASDPLRWALAGRSVARLTQVRNVLTSADPRWATLPLVPCSTHDKAALAQLAAQTKVIINCVGPFGLDAMNVVEACVTNKCHYVDLTGETSFVAMVVDRFHERAIANGVCIVPCCALMSIPADLAVLGAVHKPGVGPIANIDTIDVFERFNFDPSVGTLVSGIEELSQVGVLVLVRAFESWYGPVGAKRPHNATPRSLARLLPRYSRVAGGWLLPAPPTDALVVRRSLELLHQRRDFHFPALAQLGVYVVLPSFLHWLLAIVSLVWLLPIVIFVAKIPFLRVRVQSFLRRFVPEPTLKQRKHASLQLTAMSRNNLGEYVAVESVSCADPAYGSTAKWIAEAAMLLVRGVADPLDPASDDIAPKQGGVLTPASCFGHSLFQTLRSRQLL